MPEVVCEFLNIFLPLVQEIEFSIEVLLGTAPISKVSYCMAR